MRIIVIISLKIHFNEIMTIKSNLVLKVPQIPMLLRKLAGKLNEAGKIEN